jgi:hypothetical protein
MGKRISLCTVSVITAIAVLIPAAPASATTLFPSISPSSQSGASGTEFFWGGGWVTTAGHHYKVVFSFGDGTSNTISNTTGYSAGYSHTLVTCTGQVYTQKLSVTDLTVSHTESTTATTTVGRGRFC